MDENKHPSDYKHLTDVQIAKCLTLAKFRIPQREIARELGCDQSTIQRTLKNYDYDTFVERHISSGRSRKTSDEDDRHLLITAKRHYDLPLHDITNLSDLPISVATVTRRLKEVDIVS